MIRDSLPHLSDVSDCVFDMLMRQHAAVCTSGYTAISIVVAVDLRSAAF